MTDPFLGSEALAAGVLTPYELRSSMSRYIKTCTCRGVWN
ncbi:Conserved protein of unknown function (part1) [Mycobacterium canettii CIPT 140070010]|nr:Conserved protein of unknown function (part1) [Mycobacterium canettii CIPT 140070010]